MAAVRWARERERRDKLAALSAQQHPTKIVGRIVAIANEQQAKEFTLWSFDSWRERKKKCRKAEEWILTNANLDRTTAQ